MSCPIFGQEAVGFYAAFPTALQQSLRCPCGHHLPNGVPAEAQRSGFGGERRRKEVNEAFRPKGENGVHGLFDDAGGFGASELRWYGKRLNLPYRTPLSAQLTAPLTGEPRSALTKASPVRGGGKIRDFAGGVIQSVPQGHHNRPSGRFHSVPQSKCPWGTLAEFHFATGKISPAHRADFTEVGFCRPHAL